MKTIRSSGWFFAALFALRLLASSGRGAEMARTNSHSVVYIGTFTKTKSEGIYAFRFDPGTGRLTPLGLAAKAADPAFLAVDAGGRFLYAVNETSNFQGGNTGAVSAFAVDRESGKLTLLNQVSSGGAGPCFVSLDKMGKFVLVANYAGGSVAVFPVRRDGGLGAASAFVQHHGSSVNPERQKGPHAHSIEASPDNRFVLAADLGLDQLLVYRFDAAKGSLEPNDFPFAQVSPGAGPRHFAFGHFGRFVYLVNEMGSSVSTLSYDSGRGVLDELQTLSTLPKDFAGQTIAAEIEVDRAGKFLYASNRGHDSIAEFAIDVKKGTLQSMGFVPTQGKTPRNFAIDPTGSYLVVANQDSDNLVVFRIDPQTGRLMPNGIVPDVPSPVCVTFVARP